MNEGEATKLCLSCLISVMHVLRPNRVVVYIPFRGQSLFANDAVDSSIGYPFAFKAHRPYERIKLIHLERVPKKKSRLARSGNFSKG